MLEREAAVPGEVIRVGMGLDRPDDVDLAPVGLLQVLLDRKGGVDDGCFARARIADEVGSAAERVVDELREDHSAADASTGRRYTSCRDAAAIPARTAGPRARGRLRR